MIAILILLILMILFSLRVCINGLNCDYLSKPNTEPIKGIFVIIIFLSHIRTYADFHIGQTC